jgi:hypothetical protein
MRRAYSDKRLKLALFGLARGTYLGCTHQQRLIFGVFVVRMILSRSALAVVVATLLSSSANAGVILAGPTPAMATDQSFSLSFNSAAATTGLSFILDGYLSLDGKNFYEDDFSVNLNGNQIFLGTFNLGGGSNSGSQANVYSNPFGATLSNPTNNGTGIGWNGGKETFDFASLPSVIGLNSLTFTYTSLADANHAGFQGVGDEGWGIEQVSVSSQQLNVGAVPEASTWAMLLLGFASIGFVSYSRKGKSFRLV